MKIYKEQRNIQILMHKVDNTGYCPSVGYMCDMIALRLLKVLQCVLYKGKGARRRSCSAV